MLICRSEGAWIERILAAMRSTGGILIEIVGEVTERVVSLLEIEPAQDRNIYWGLTNQIHMQSDHPEAFKLYGSEIPNILSNPDYVRLSTNNSIEYVKEFMSNGEYVKVAVRLSGGQKYYARTLYVLNRGRVENFIQNGQLKSY